MVDHLEARKKENTLSDVHMYDKLSRNAKNSSGIGNKKKRKRVSKPLQTEGNVGDTANDFVLQEERVKTRDPKPLSVC
jgi:hypothetical protein